MEYGYEPPRMRPGSLTAAAVIGITYAVLGLLCNCIGLGSALLQDKMKEMTQSMGPGNSDLVSLYKAEIAEAEHEIDQLTEEAKAEGRDPATDPEIQRLQGERARFAKIVELQSRAESRAPLIGGADNLLGLITNILLIVFCVGALKGAESSRSYMVLLAWLKIVLVIVGTVATYFLVQKDIFEAMNLAMQDQMGGQAMPPGMSGFLSAAPAIGLAVGILFPVGLLLGCALPGASQSAREFCQSAGPRGENY